MDSYRIYQTFREVFVLLEFGNHEALSPFQLDHIEYSALQLLDLNTGCRLVELRERLLCDKSKMTRMINALESRGLTRRQPDPVDHRAWQVFLTEEGDRLRQQAQAAFRAALDQRFTVIGAAEKEQFFSTLKTLRTQLLLERNQK